MEWCTRRNIQNLRISSRPSQRFSAKFHEMWSNRWKPYATITAGRSKTLQKSADYCHNFKIAIQLTKLINHIEILIVFFFISGVNLCTQAPFIYVFLKKRKTRKKNKRIKENEDRKNNSFPLISRST